MRCIDCKYDLSNLTEPRCPECGRAFDPDHPGTFNPPPSATIQTRALHLLMVVAISGILSLLFCGCITMTRLDSNGFDAGLFCLFVLFNWPIAFLVVLTLYVMLWPRVAMYLAMRRSKRDL